MTERPTISQTVLYGFSSTGLQACRFTFAEKVRARVSKQLLTFFIAFCISCSLATKTVFLERTCQRNPTVAEQQLWSKIFGCFYVQLNRQMKSSPRLGSPHVVCEEASDLCWTKKISTELLNSGEAAAKCLFLWQSVRILMSGYLAVVTLLTISANFSGEVVKRDLWE